MNMPDEGFEVAYMKEAENFLNGLRRKVHDKIFFNITKVMNGVSRTKNCSRNWTVLMIFGSSAPSMTEWNTAYWHFGTRTHSVWSLPLMAWSRRRGRFPLRKLTVPRH